MVYVAFCLCIFLLGYDFYEKRKNTSFLYKDHILLDEIICFSNKALARTIKEHLDVYRAPMYIEFAKGKFVYFEVDDDNECILKKIDDMQNVIIDARYTKEFEPLLVNTLDEQILDIWLDYSYKDNYRYLFVKHLNRMYGSREISTATYNRLYMRFYRRV